jgi:nitrogen fixation/metabolism regulation signal transduction histidine kinase
MSGPGKTRRGRYDQRVLLLAILAGAPGVLLAAGLILPGRGAQAGLLAALVLALVLWLGFAAATQEAVVRPLQTLSNLLGAMREGDFSFRARGAEREDSLGEVFFEVNALAETLRQQRLGALEATALLRKVMEEIDVAIFALDADGKLRLANQAGQRLLAAPEDQLLSRPGAELGLGPALEGDHPRVSEMAFPGGAGRFEVRLGTFREGGLPLQLLVLTNVSRALREEERQAWQRLIRVLGHELNNSLAAIGSIAQSLEHLLAREVRPPDADSDVSRGLAVISARSASLGRFMDSYARLARLPPPRVEPLEIGSLVGRVAGLETRATARLLPGPEIRVLADPDQLEQLLINLVKNAAEACPGGTFQASWRPVAGSVEVAIEDEGPGVPQTANLFVPFFTTKQGGSGLGLVLSRQIAEAHGGSLRLENRQPGPGCRAVLRLPV